MRTGYSRHLVASSDEVIANIRRFADEVGKEPKLQARLGLVHSWYAVQAPNGDWTFGPSKFVGYRDNSAKVYLRTYDLAGGADGNETEKRLDSWFEPVDPGSRLGRELHGALQAFLVPWGRMMRKGARISVLNSALQETRPRGNQWPESLMERISADPRICGGRPCIKGTRMRVSDVVDMLAHGATQAEILADYPYLAKEDITAALAYAARSADHRTIRAA